MLLISSSLLVIPRGATTVLDITDADYTNGNNYSFALTVNNSGGSCTSDGTYTAGKVASTDTVTVSDSRGQSQSIQIAVI